MAEVVHGVQVPSGIADWETVKRVRADLEEKAAELLDLTRRRLTGEVLVEADISEAENTYNTAHKTFRDTVRSCMFTYCDAPRRTPKAEMEELVASLSKRGEKV